MLKNAVVAAALAALSAVQAQASERASVRVSYADLDLSRQQDRAQLDKRLVKAARQVCRRQFPSAVLAEAVACQGNAMKDARGQVGRVLLALEAKGARLASK